MCTVVVRACGRVICGSWNAPPTATSPPPPPDWATTTTPPPQRARTPPTPTHPPPTPDPHQQPTNHTPPQMGVTVAMSPNPRGTVTLRLTMPGCLVGLIRMTMPGCLVGLIRMTMPGCLVG